MDDQRLFDLAMKVAAHKCTEAERAELETAMAANPELRAEFAKLQEDVLLAKQVLPLVAATESTEGTFPAYARERLQTKVRQTLVESQPAMGKPAWNWRWVLGFATGAALLLFLILPQFTKPGPVVVQVAMLDTAGGARGGDTNDVEILTRQWKGSSVQTFESARLLADWETNHLKAEKRAVQVVYDRAAGEIRVSVFSAGKPQQKTFTVDRDLTSSLQQVSLFIQEAVK